MENVSHFDYFGITRVASSPWQPRTAGLSKCGNALPFQIRSNVYKRFFSKCQPQNLLRKIYFLEIVGSSKIISRSSSRPSLKSRYFLVPEGLSMT